MKLLFAVLRVGGREQLIIGRESKIDSIVITASLKERFSKKGV
jgi:hypothetical protein